MRIIFFFKPNVILYTKHTHKYSCTVYFARISFDFIPFHSFLFIISIQSREFDYPTKKEAKEKDGRNERSAWSKGKCSHRLLGAERIRAWQLNTNYTAQLSFRFGDNVIFVFALLSSLLLSCKCSKWPRTMACPFKCIWLAVQLLCFFFRFIKLP